MVSSSLLGCQRRQRLERSFLNGHQPNERPSSSYYRPAPPITLPRSLSLLHLSSCWSYQQKGGRPFHLLRSQCISLPPVITSTVPPPPRRHQPSRRHDFHQRQSMQLPPTPFRIMMIMTMAVISRQKILSHQTRMPTIFPSLRRLSMMYLLWGGRRLLGHILFW